MMRPSLLWAMLIPVCMAAAWVIVRRGVRILAEDRDLSKARAAFHLQREWLEVRFLNELARTDPVERPRWDDARWHDEVVWARDRQTRRLLALIGVHFDADPFLAAEFSDVPPHHATALFEYRRGGWLTKGKHFDEIRPAEAFLRHREFEPVVEPETRG